MDSAIVNNEDINQLLAKDAVFQHIYELYGAPPNWSRPQGFVSLSKIILEQQVSLVAANAHFQKLNDYLGTFSASNLVHLSDEEMRNCHISRQKAKYLRALSNSIIDGSIHLELLPSLDEIEIRKQLMSIKGIGNWTADIYLMFCLQKKNIFPIGDVAIVNTVKELWQAKTREEILILTEQWKPHCSLAAYFLWHYYLKKRNREVA